MSLEINKSALQRPPCQDHQPGGQFTWWVACALLIASNIMLVPTAKAAPAYGDNDLCGLQTLLILEQAQKHPKVSYSRFHRGIMAELINSDLLHGQSNNRKIALLNEAQRNASIVYPQRAKLSSSSTFKALKHRLWHDCGKRLASSCPPGLGSMPVVPSRFHNPSRIHKKPADAKQRHQRVFTSGK